MNNQEVEVLRFTRVLFGLTQSPFLLNGTVAHHLQTFQDEHPSIVEAIKQSLYVDDVIHGADTVDEATDLKRNSIEIFADGGFQLHKWHSNVPSLGDEEENNDGEITYAKQKLGAGIQSTKILGLYWNKQDDELAVKIPTSEHKNTKRGVLKFLASIYDPLGVISPIMLVGKCIFRELCETKHSWDEQIRHDLAVKWQKFKKCLPAQATFPRAISDDREAITFVDLHAFGDASQEGTAAAVYAVIHKPSGVSQGLVAAKARLSKKSTIPRLELTAGHMAANLISNVRNVLAGIPIRQEVGWTDSTVALHWIRAKGNNYKQFVSNQARKIAEKGVTKWRHVPGVQNPADIASRGGSIDQLTDLWWKGPSWLTNEEKWPEDVLTTPNNDTEEEARKIKEVLHVAIDQDDVLNQVMEKFPYKKAVRITAWVIRFTQNLRGEGRSGPLVTQELENATQFWVKKTQRESEMSLEFEKQSRQLNLQKNKEGIYICKGRIVGDYPIYLPKNAIFTNKFVMAAHRATLHGGVGLTMTLLREKYWIPCLRQLVKRIRRSCYGCKRFQAQPMHAPPAGSLPMDRISGERAFQTIGLDYCGPFIYKKSTSTTGKGYILLFTCSLTRAICLEFVEDQLFETFISSLKRMVARRGRPEKIYSDNFKTFVAASNWIKRVTSSEAVHDFLASQSIKWQFNMSRASWWGGQFERMVGLTKQALYKSIGASSLTWKEYVDVLLDVEIALNNRPLSYVDDDVEMPILTPNIMLFGQPNHVPDHDADEIDELDLRKRAKFLRKCKEAIWSRWRNEYLRGLREKHDLTHHRKSNAIKVGDVVIIKGDEKNRSKWNIGIVVSLITGSDGVIRGAKLRAGKNRLERAVQHLYPMELSCDREISPLASVTTNSVANSAATASSTGGVVSGLNATASEFRPRRAAAAIADIRINEQAEEDELGPEIE